MFNNRFSCRMCGEPITPGENLCPHHLELHGVMGAIMYDGDYYDEEVTNHLRQDFPHELGGEG